MSEILTTKEVARVAFDAASKVFDLRSINKEPEDPISIKEASGLTGYKVSTLYVYVSNNQIPFHKIPHRKRLFFYRSELLNWMKEGINKEVSNG